MELLFLLEQITANRDLKQTSSQLASLYKDPSSIAGLVSIACGDHALPIRQLALIEVRKLVQKRELWEKVDRDSLKSLLLNTALESTTLRHSFVHVISECARHELSQGRWSDLIPTLINCCSSHAVGYREIGVFVMYSLIDVIPEQFHADLVNSMRLFTSAIVDESLYISVTSAQALVKLSEFIEPHQTDIIVLWFKSAFFSATATADC
jgi:hypothetical protein